MAESNANPNPNIVQNDDNADAQVSRIAVKLPQFWPDKARLWFVQAEAQFTLGKITAEKTKFAHVVTMLDSSTADQVLDILIEPPEAPYTALRERLTKTFAIPDSEKASRIIDMDGLGDKTPSQCMTKMLNLVPTGEEPGFLFQELFLRQLPSETRTQLVQSTNTGTSKEALRALALEADKFFSSMGARISAVAAQFGVVPGSSAAQVDAVSVSGGLQLCFYHAQFGAQAKKCQQPCQWKKLTSRKNPTKPWTSSKPTNQGNSHPGQGSSN